MQKGQSIDFIKKSILNSSLRLSQQIYKIVSESLERELDLNFRLTFEDYNHIEMGFGIKAAEPIHENKEIMRIPVAIGFNGLDLIDFKEDISKKTIKDLCWKIAKNFFPDEISLKFRQEKNFQNQMLMWQVILNSYYKEAYNHDLVNSFPESDLTQPVFASENTFNLISSRNLKKYYFDNKLYLKNLYEIISKEAIYEVTFDEMAWAYNNVLSRKMIIVEPVTGNPYQLILPIVDYINHSSSEANCIAEPIYDSNKASSYVSIKAAKYIKENDQLFFDYGPMYNKKFMNMYGFFDSSNPIVESDFLFVAEPDYLIPLLEIDQNEGNGILQLFYQCLESQKDLKNQILQKNNLNFSMFYPQFNLMLYKDKFETKFLKFLRVVFLNDDELSNMESLMNHDFSDLYSFENEKKIFSFISIIMNKHFSFVKDKNHQDLISSLGKIDSVEKYKTKSMYKLEEEEKILLEKNIKYIENKRKSLH